MGFLSLNNFLEVIQNFPMDYVLYIFKSIEIKFLKEIFCKLKDELEIVQINENCVEFLREAQNYYADEKGRFSDPDDCIDSARYALLGCLNGWAEPWDNRSPQSRFATAKHNLRQMRAVKNRKYETDPLKRIYGPEE